MTLPDNENQSPLVSMRGMTKRFPGVVAVDHVDLELYRGKVLALLGENGAGKSTLMNLLAGLYRPDEGEIHIKGRRVRIRSPRDAAALGIGMVHQNFMLVETMTVAENTILGMKGLAFIPDMKKVGRGIRELSERYGLQVDPEAYIWQLGVGEQQRVEILKLLYRGVDILILDEPTAVLTPQEAGDLGRNIRQMTAEGKAAVFITHKMEEVMTFSDEVRVLRGGKSAAVKVTRETDPRELARLMVGREVLFAFDKQPCRKGEPVLELEHISARSERGLTALKDVSLRIHGGEILGIAGVAGNGQRELAEVITGLRRPSGGRLIVKREDKTYARPLAMIRSGVSHIPADRMAMGIVGSISVAGNLVMKAYRQAPICRKGLFRPKQILIFAKRLIEAFRIATPRPQTEAKFLSGGNIQKIILAREIEACGGLLIAVYPSRGLDVGATEAVRQKLLEQRDQGNAVLLISEDLEELLSVADRIAVLFEGRIQSILDAERADIESLGLLMAGVHLPPTEQWGGKNRLSDVDQIEKNI
ncbi:MAG: ABC transporter ATP-binding protein [Desulfobacteraceae bacterium]|nr:MAG: ABC transporter ATP-binding protein [Desulfobacteraceae bacterium]